MTSGSHAVKICFGIANKCHISLVFNELSRKYT